MISFGRTALSPDSISNYYSYMYLEKIIHNGKDKTSGKNYMIHNMKLSYLYNLYNNSSNFTCVKEKLSICEKNSSNDNQYGYIEIYDFNGELTSINYSIIYAIINIQKNTIKNHIKLENKDNSMNLFNILYII